MDCVCLSSILPSSELRWLSGSAYNVGLAVEVFVSVDISRKLAGTVAALAMLALVDPAVASASADTSLSEPAESATIHGEVFRPAKITVMSAAPGGWVSSAGEPGPGHVSVSYAADIVGDPVDISVHMAMGEMPDGMPVAGARLSSGFGMRRHPILGSYRAHRGVDYAAATGTPVRATAAGVVRKADWNGGYGLAVDLDNGKGVKTRYGHMSRLNVSAGQRVKKGDVIGYVGSTGRSTGPHLHYEVHVNGKAVNPLSHKGH